MWRIATLNMNGIVNPTRVAELRHEMNRRQIDIAFLQETRHADGNSEFIRDYCILNSGTRQNEGARKYIWGAAIAIHESLAPFMRKVERTPGNIMRVEMAPITSAPWGEKKRSHLTSACIPLKDREAREARDALHEHLAKIPENDHVMIGGDFNAHISGTKYDHENPPRRARSQGGI